MRVFLASLGLGGQEDLPLDQFRDLARVDRVGNHGLVDDAESADLILFPQCHMLPRDWGLKVVTSHPLVNRYPEKTMVYDERDRPWCALPGVYVSMSRRRFNHRYQRAWGYAGFSNSRRVVDCEASPKALPDLLFSLIASPTDRCRRPLFRLQEPDSVVEEVRRFVFYDSSSARFGERRKRFDEVLQRSRFVLCPRGRGTSSIRLFETLASGRVPVIISDDWVPVDGPDWESFSIRWPEGRTRGLVAELRSRDGDWAAMSAAARAAHDTWFAPDVMFDRIVSLCTELMPYRETFARRSRFHSVAAVSNGAEMWRSLAVSRLRALTRRRLGRLRS